jgi:hypothetical protein
MLRGGVPQAVVERMSGTRGSGVPTHSGPDAQSRVLDRVLSERPARILHAVMDS